jgi:hypothetical protein
MEGIMAVLSDTDRVEVWADLMQKFSADGESIGVTKTDLRAAVNAIDAFLNDNAATINSAIPQPARGALTAPQKAILLMFVVSRRYLSGA